MSMFTEEFNAATNPTQYPKPTPANFVEAAREELDRLKYECGYKSEADRGGAPILAPADYVREARRVLNSLKYRSGSQDEADRTVAQIHDLLKGANMTAGIKPPSTGYDLWALDQTWDTDPLNGRSNAEMAAELEKTVERFVDVWMSLAQTNAIILGPALN